MTARDEILTRVRTALRDAPQAHPVPRDYRTESDQPPGSEDVVELFVERVRDYKANVHRTTSAGMEKLLGTVVLGDHNAVVPPGLPESWRAALESRVSAVHVDNRPAPLAAAELDGIAVVVTACRLAIAETGTIVLDGQPDQGRRATTLVPDHHVVVVFAEQIVASVPEAVARLDGTRPLTFISGPSATSDIEFNRVEGVHGPRRLDVLVVTDGVVADGVTDRVVTDDAG
jgi:L-lactate dehydrogenase complex protein LldG